MIENTLKWDKAKGSNVWINGKKYIDFTSSIFTQNFGHNNPYVIKEVKKQLDKCTHAYGYDTEIKNKYIKKLKEVLGYKNILLFSTGSEAIEAAIKICNHNGHDASGICNAMHGRTLGSEILAGKRASCYIDGGKVVDTVMNLYSKTTEISKGAIFIEGYRGYDCKGLNKDEIDRVKYLQKNGNLIVFDEIQSGFFRTSEMFVSEYYGIKPDILVVGKSVGGGFPLSAICWNKDFNIKGIELTSTHSGQPLQMAAGYGVLNYVVNKLNLEKYYNNIMIMNIFWDGLEIEHNNLGMVGAFKFENEDLLYRSCLIDNLLIVKTWKGWIKIAPPVNIGSKELKKGLDILKKHIIMNNDTNKC